MKTLVELTVRYGEYGENSKTVAIQISEELTRELLCRRELSNELFSLILASPGAFGGHGDAITIRERTFKMRRDIAIDIAQAMIPELMKAFGINDELDGYKIDEMSEDERAWHHERGRL
jgi:hypothetical protein